MNWSASGKCLETLTHECVSGREPTCVSGVFLTIRYIGLNYYWKVLLFYWYKLEGSQLLSLRENCLFTSFHTCGFSNASIYIAFIHLICNIGYYTIINLVRVWYDGLSPLERLCDLYYVRLYLFLQWSMNSSRDIIQLSHAVDIVAYVGSGYEPYICHW